MFAPVPPKTIPDSGTRPVFEDAAVTVKFPAAVSASEIVKAIGADAVLTVVDVAEIPEIVGPVLPALTVTETEALAEREPSDTVSITVAVPD